MQELPDNIVGIDRLNKKRLKDLDRDGGSASAPAETPAYIFAPGKTETIKAIARQLGLPMTETDLKDLMGAPAGYQGYKPTPEDDAALKKSMDEMKADLNLAVSLRSGDELAAACHNGLWAPSARMKPLRLKTGFIAC